MTEDLKKALDKFSSGLILYEPITYDENMLLASIRADFEDVLQMFSVFQKDHEQENAVRIEQIKDEKNTKIDALQLAILTIYKPEIEKLKRKLDETHSLVKDNVHVPHKQLSELLAKAPNYEQLDSVGGMESYAVQMWGSDVEKWIAELKELLEART